MLLEITATVIISLYDNFFYFVFVDEPNKGKENVGKMAKSLLHVVGIYDCFAFRMRVMVCN